MALTDDQWVVISGAGGALGSALASHFASRGRRVLGLDRTFDRAAPALGVTASTVDLLVEAEVRQALTDTIPANDAIALLVNAVGLIWNEPVLALRGAKLATHSLETWRKVTDANLTAPFIVATQVAARMVRRGGGSIVIEVQRRLAREGFYRGSIDGVMGSRTHYAIRAYERSHGLTPDGEIDDRLLGAMGLR